MNFAAIILAAGQSERFGKANKSFATYKDKPLIDHCLNLVLGIDFIDRILVTGFEHGRVENHVKDLAFRTVHNPDYKQGMGLSLAGGVKALKPECDAFMIFLADMPDIPKETIHDIIKAFENGDTDQTIVRPIYEGKPGHPVMFSASYRTELQNLSGDQGAFEIIQKHKTSTLNVEASSSAVIRDVDRGNDIQ